jgi:serine/threonine protein kinase
LHGKQSEIAHKAGQAMESRPREIHPIHVYLAREKNSRFIVVPKVLNKSQLQEQSMLCQFGREIEVQASIRHPNVAGLFGYLWDRTRINLIVEYCAGPGASTSGRRAIHLSDGGRVAGRTDYGQLLFG